MDFSFNAEEKAFQQEVKDFIRDNLKPDMVYDGGLNDTPERREMITKMAKKGWLKIGFPTEYGGDGADKPMHKFILNMELLLAGGPIIGKALGQIAGCLMFYGSEELKREFIPPTLRNDIQWGITYSEPGAGSDLASMRTSAVLDGDEFVINGEKRWITSAHYAQYLWVAVRTDPNVPKHKGISIIIVDRNAPGITLQPIKLMSDIDDTNSVFFDNVRVPRSRLVGEINRGWYYMMNALNFERFLMIGISNQRRHYKALIEWVREQKINGKPLTDDSAVRHKLAKVDMLMEMGRMLDLRCIALMASHSDRTPAVAAFMYKAMCAIAFMELANTTLDLLGPDGYLMEGDEAPFGGQMARNYFEAGHLKVAAAGLDVAKNMIARQHLGLPS